MELSLLLVDKCIKDTLNVVAGYLQHFSNGKTGE